MADPEFHRRKGHQPQGRGGRICIIFGLIVPENCLKIKEDGPKEGLSVTVAPFDPSLSLIIICRRGREWPSANWDILGSLDIVNGSNCIFKFAKHNQKKNPSDLLLSLSIT